MTNTEFIPKEIDEQANVVEYLELLKAQGKVILYTALPNNTFTRSWKQKAKQKREGVKPGFPDMVIVFKDRVLFLEMKKKKGGTVRENQWEWLTSLADKNTTSAVANGFDEAKEIINNLLER